MLDLFELSLAIIPFIFGLIAISLIPGKEKIINNQIKKYGVEKQVVVYMIGFFILAIGTYYFITSIFAEMVENQRWIYILNGLFLGIIGIGIMGVNYRNFSLLSEPRKGLETRVGGAEVADVVEVAEVAEVAEVTEVSEISPAKTIAKKPPTFKTDTQLVECPRCSNIIKVMSAKRPVKISCPKCGIEGLIQ